MTEGPIKHQKSDWADPVGNLIVGFALLFLGAWVGQGAFNRLDFPFDISYADALNGAHLLTVAGWLFGGRK